MRANYRPPLRFSSGHPRKNLRSKFLSPSHKEFNISPDTVVLEKKKTVRATRPALLSASSPKTNIRATISSKLLVPRLGNSVGQNFLTQNVQPLPWGDSSRFRALPCCRLLCSRRGGRMYVLKKPSRDKNEGACYRGEGEGGSAV